MNVGRLVAQVADKSQQKTQQLGPHGTMGAMVTRLYSRFCWLLPFIFIEAMIDKTTKWTNKYICVFAFFSLICGDHPAK